MKAQNELINTFLDIGRQCLIQRQGMSMEVDISQVDFAVIDALPIKKGISCKELAETMSLSTSRCSRIVERLQSKRYVERKTNPNDRRAVEVSLTEKGLHLKKDIENLKAQCEKRILKNMGEKDIEIVKKGIEILRKSLRMQ